VPNRFDQQHLSQLGFVGFERLSALPKGCGHLPASPGIYAVLAYPPARHGFLERSVGGRFKGRDGTVPIDALVARWIDDAGLLYVGRSNSLRRRVDELARYGRGEPIGHRGGRYLWQLAEHDELRVAWHGIVDSVQAEREFLDDFEAQFGQLPFANLVRGTRGVALV
jgi:hypothetical protein